VEELLGVDQRELLCVPDPTQVRIRHRRSLAAVVPAAEGRDEHGTRQLGALLDLELRRLHQRILSTPGRQGSATNATVPPQRTAESVTWVRTSHHGSFVRYWISPTAICAASTASTASAARTWRSRRNASQPSNSANELPNTAVART